MAIALVSVRKVQRLPVLDSASFRWFQWIYHRTQLNPSAKLVAPLGKQYFEKSRKYRRRMREHSENGGTEDVEGSGRNSTWSRSGGEKEKDKVLHGRADSTEATAVHRRPMSECRKSIRRKEQKRETTMSRHQMPPALPIASLKQ